VKAVTIDPSAVDPEDVEILADMVLAAVNEALRMAQELAERKMGGATGGMDLGAASAGSACRACEHLLRPPCSGS
jgi:DNA-binding protein YbaB